MLNQRSLILSTKPLDLSISLLWMSRTKTLMPIRSVGVRLWWNWLNVKQVWHTELKPRLVLSIWDSWWDGCDQQPLMLSRAQARPEENVHRLLGYHNLLVWLQISQTTLCCMKLLLPLLGAELGALLFFPPWSFLTPQLYALLHSAVPRAIVSLMHLVQNLK